jgi:FlaG/FlaF family flagellin (archaellin)
MRQKNYNRNQAISEIVGEMLMIGIVLILAAVFTSQLPNYLPSERSPTVTIMMSNDTSGNVTLWHKGGDWVKVDTLKVIISNRSGVGSEQYTSTNINFKFAPDPAEAQDTQTFDLGSTITIISGTSFGPGTTITLSTDRAELFSGVVSEVQP